MTLSYPILRRSELIIIISELIMSSLHISMEDIEKMPYQERCEMINKNVVLVARHFQYSVEVYCYEWTFRKNSIHSFIWILNAPILTKSEKLE